MTTPSRRGAIVGLCAAAAATSLGSLVILALPRTTPLPDTYGLRGFSFPFVAVIALVGALIAWRQPRNAVGWIFLLSATAGGIQVVATEYAAYALVERQGAVPGGDWAALAAAMALPFFVGTISSILFLVFPDGRPPSPRWRPVGWYTILGLVAWAITVAVVPGTFNAQGYARNPLWPPEATFPLDQSTVMPISILIVLPSGLLCAASLVWRFRHTRGVERQQVKWMAYAGSIVAVGVLAVPAAFDHKWLQVVQQLTVLLIPAAAGIAILRDHLYDIDLLINRTIVYGALSALLGALYAASVILLQPLLRPLTAGSELAVAISTLGVLAVFQPIRRRIQRAVDRRFYRSRYDAARTLDAFSVRLRDEVDLDAVRAELVSAVRDTVQPAHASVWLRQ